MFQLFGTINGEAQQLTYTFEDGCGSVSGDEMAMFLFRSALERESTVGPPGVYLERDVNEPPAALFMMRECFEELTGSAGCLPELEQPPEGALA